MRLLLSRSVLFAIILCLTKVTFGLAAPNDDKELRILRVTPAGDNAPVGRQIVIQFNRSVVPIGQAIYTDPPIEIKPKLD